MPDRSTFNAANRAYMSRDMYPYGQGETLQIRDVREVTKTKRDGSGSWKALQLWWMEERPPLDLTGQNVDWLVATFGPNDDAWIRKKVYVWNDPKLTRGLALDEAQEPKGAPAAKPGPDPALRQKLAQKPQESPDDDIPF